MTHTVVYGTLKYKTPAYDIEVAPFGQPLCQPFVFLPERAGSSTEETTQ